MSWSVAAVLALVTWGAFAFGAVYPWAYWPLFAGCLIVGGAALLRRQEGSTAKPLAIGLAALLCAVALQLLPVPTSMLRSISPETDTFLHGYDMAYAGAGSHPLSIEPT